MEDDDEEEEDSSQSSFQDKYLPSLSSLVYPFVLFKYIDFFENFYIRSFYPQNPSDVGEWFRKFVYADKDIIQVDDDSSKNADNSSENADTTKKDANEQQATTSGDGNEGTATSTDTKTSDKDSTPFLERIANKLGFGKPTDKNLNRIEFYIINHMSEFLEEKDLISHLFFSEKHMYKVFDVDNLVCLLNEVRESNSKFVDDVK